MGMAADATGPFDGQVWMFAMTRKLLYYIFVLRVSLICNPTPHPLVGGTIAIGRRRRRWSKLCYSLFFSFFLFCFHFARWTTLPCCERWAELTVALGSSSSSSIAWRRRVALTSCRVTLGRSLCAQHCLLPGVNREGTCSSVKVRKSTLSV